MPHQEDVHYQASLLGNAPSPFSSTIFKVGAALLGGAGLALLSVGSTSTPFQSAGEAKFTNLVSGPASLRQGSFASVARQLPGQSPLKELAIAAVDASKHCGRDVSMRAMTPQTPQLQAAYANLDRKGKAQLSQLNVMVQAKAKAKASQSGGAAAYGDLPGVLPPLNWFDPLGFATDVDEGKLLFYREAELKHGRVCMLATLGFLVGERYHPWFGGDIDVPSVFTFGPGQVTNLNAFWPVLVAAMGAIEARTGNRGGSWSKELPSDLEVGDLGYDPLGIEPEDPEEFRDMQNRELLHGRLAMISFLGMVAEELVTKEKLSGLPF